ncbi:hypothetical protein TSTA_060770 [Talaromyces stipitatus ATCC 10500]|uniref:Uncharacterized protein n=1 Tax=Talaromyces stipitatus (strain ATCC 10500 / CBS 375.48 / QM 6759 / NRRL 1006) TaxID=441959 RepID=B8LUB3_TALSN|nr:uncharacterized protein TSTA_060770 [Talaromyces stipitatus ATCC 10500]EED22585.1 hypothetical protein TSTA_060770 [Talaromyces stipitatus ATCC 10500]
MDGHLNTDCFPSIDSFPLRTQFLINTGTLDSEYHSFGLVYCIHTIMTRKTNRNAALTIAQSTIGNSLGPFVTTVLIKLYTSTHVWYPDILPKTSGILVPQLGRDPAMVLGWAWSLLHEYTN